MVLYLQWQLGQTSDGYGAFIKKKGEHGRQIVGCINNQRKIGKKHIRVP